MTNPTVIHSTFQLERKLKASPQRVFAAFADEATKRRWFFEGGTHALEDHQLDFKVGGKERAQMKMGPGTPVAGKTLVNETIYEDIVPSRRIVAAYKMSMDGIPFSASLATIELAAQRLWHRSALHAPGRVLRKYRRPRNAQRWMGEAALEAGERAWRVSLASPAREGGRRGR